MKLQQLRNQIVYEELPEWRKFLHAYRFTIKNIGLKGLYLFPITYIKLWKIKRNAQ